MCHGKCPKPSFLEPSFIGTYVTREYVKPRVKPSPTLRFVTQVCHRGCPIVVWTWALTRWGPTLESLCRKACEWDSRVKCSLLRLPNFHNWKCQTKNYKLKMFVQLVFEKKGLSIWVCWYWKFDKFVSKITNLYVKTPKFLTFCNEFSPDCKARYW